MANTIVLSEKEWTPIRKRLKEDYAWKPSVLLIRESMKRELGFTVRSHEEWDSRIGYTVSICLDFYNDQQETLFRLKYL